MPRTPSDWITLREASELLAAAGVPVTPSTVGRWARTGKLQTIRPGHRVFVRRKQVRGLLQPARRGVPLEALQGRLFEE
jgi:hypothetical protein